MMKWRRGDAWHIKSGIFTICKALVRDASKYSLFCREELVDTFDDPDAARAAADAMSKSVK